MALHECLEDHRQLLRVDAGARITDGHANPLHASSAATRSAPRHIGCDISAVFRNIAGGEIHEYTKRLADSREQSVDRDRQRATKGSLGNRTATRAGRRNPGLT
jgi:hypothetical protein